MKLLWWEGGCERDRLFGLANDSRKFSMNVSIVFANGLPRFGSEMAWDSTGQEGIYVWSRYFGDETTAVNAINSILAYQPLVPHWGYNGNARRYWYVFNHGLIGGTY